MLQPCDFRGLVFIGTSVGFGKHVTGIVLVAVKKEKNLQLPGNYKQVPGYNVKKVD